MRRPRFIYSLLIISTIILGLLSRRFSFIPSFIGDILWALLVYFLFRFMLINATSRKVMLCSLLFCFTIEFSQLYTAPWIDHLRQTLFGKLVLGTTFYWPDLFYYTLGVFIGAATEWCITRNNRTARSA